LQDCSPFLSTIINSILNSIPAGFFIRVVLLCGSRFKRQLIPDTYTIFPLAFLGVFFSAGMQFILAWYLWTRLPQSYPGTNGDSAVLKPYPGTEGGRGYFQSPHAFARVPLPAYQYPNYQFANDICRTAPIVQLVCVGLFLFSILNNVPGIMKNIAIILASERFVSEDEDGITKLHYWRESDYSREPENRFLQRFCNEYLSDAPTLSSKSRMTISVFICEMYFKGSILTSGKRQAKRSVEQEEDVKLFASAARRRWMLPTFFPAVQPWASRRSQEEDKAKVMRDLEMSEDIPRSFFEVNETRSFIAEALRLIDNENNVKPTGTKEALVAYDSLEEEDHRDLDLNLVRGEKPDGGAITEPQPIQFCDEARFNLVRVDYLKPSTSWLRPHAYRFAKAAKKQTDDNAADLGAVADASLAMAGAPPAFAGSLPEMAGAFPASTQGRPATPEGLTFFGLLTKQLGKQFSDLTTAVRLLPFPARMRRFRLLALLLGVLPEVLTLTMITVTGIPYILWSGFKVDSDTQGMEEIILATLAIVFIYDIDESVYDHILPELYKEAHERDRFELSRGWISSETPRTLSALAVARRPSGRAGARGKKEQDKAKRDEEKRMRRFLRSDPLVWVVKREDGKPDKEDSPHDPDVELSMSGTTAQLCSAEDEKEKEEKKKLFDGMTLLTRQFDRAMAVVNMTAERAMAMSVSDHWNDLYLARAYPFLYARKLRYALASHVWEWFLIFYGSSGLHYVVLLGLTLIIVGGYRSLARCERFAPSDSIAGIFSAQPWPSTCLLGVGPTTDKFSRLNGSSADKFMAVTCGVSGYVPGPEEWQKNMDFFTKEERR
jgi:hypothetical protein